MLLEPQLPDSGRAGDLARRRAGKALLVFLVGLPVSVWLFVRLPEIWASILPLEGAPFMLAATALGGALAVAPLLTAAAMLVAVWYGVESVYLPRTRPSPVLDRIIVALGLAVWFGPTAALVAASGHAISVGKIHFSRPPRDYYLATDPIAFWQGVGTWLVIAAAIAYPAWRYWRGKFVRT